MQDNQEIVLNSRNGWLGWWPRTGIKSIFDPENARVFEFLVEQKILTTGYTAVFIKNMGK